MPFKIVVAIHNDSSCAKEIEFVVHLCSTLKAYKLYFVYAVEQNTKTSIPYMDHMTTSYNLEIHEEAKKEMHQLIGEMLIDI